MYNYMDFWIIINCKSLNTVYMSCIVYLRADNVMLATLCGLVLIYLLVDEDVVVSMKSLKSIVLMHCMQPRQSTSLPSTLSLHIWQPAM